MLYVGRLSAEKGVHTAISAFDYLSKRDKEGITLEIYGRGSNEYENVLKSHVVEKKLEDKVIFHGAVSHQEIPRIMSEHDVLVFPSEWEEPFARTVLEAMASGLVVIGTTTGGTCEVLCDCETGLTYPPGDAASLAKQISRLRWDEDFILDCLNPVSDVSRKILLWIKWWII
jgi:glycogen synthase